MKPLMLAALFVAGCAELSLAPPLTSPKDGGAAWTEVSSRHFIVRSDLGPARARELCTALEQIEGAFEDLISTAQSVPRDRILAVSFARHDDYLEVAKQHRMPNSGAFFSHSSHDVEPVPTIVLSGDLDNEKRTLLQHELTHRFLRLQMSDPPLWLNEGLAEYNSTLMLRDGMAWFGAMPPHSSGLLRANGRFLVGKGATQRSVTIDDLPSVQSLLAATPDTFYDRIEDNPAPEHPLMYQGAWLLVHMLKSRQLPYHPRFDRLVELLTHGVRRGDAFTQAFAGVSIGELEAQYRKYAAEMMANRVDGGDRWTLMLRTAYVPRAAAPIDGEEKLSDAQVHLLFLQLRSWQPPNRDAAAHDLTAAQIDTPGDPEVLYWGVRLALSGGAKGVDAERTLRLALQKSPREPRYWLALLDLRVDLAANGRETTTVAPEAYAPLDDDAHQLARVAHSAQALNMLGWYFALRQQPEVGLPFAMRSVQADPTCGACFDTLALLSYQHGDLAEAAQWEEHAYELLPESASGRLPEVIKASLERYRAAAAAKPAATTPTH
jgi:hypothetical protein